MSLETSNATPDLEAFKENSAAPFETVKKNELPTPYPKVFSALLKSNWEKACKLMEWKKDTKTPEWSFFEVAKDPVEVVKSIQNKIVEKGGVLPKYGVDGKFGPETQEALEKVSKVEVLPSPKPKDQPEKEKTSPAKPSEAAERALLQKKMREAMDAMPKVEARLESAGIKPDKDVWEKGVSDLDLMNYQGKAKKLRESAMEEEPLLKPLGPLVDSIIPTVEAAVEKIDLSKINSLEDLTHAVGALEKDLSAKMDAYKDTLSEAKVKEIMENAKMESLLTFFLSAFYEMAMVLVNHFSKDKENLKRIVEMLMKEFEPVARKIARQSGTPFPDEPKVDIQVRDLNPKTATPTPHEFAQGEADLKMDYRGQPVLMNLPTKSIYIGDKKAHLVLPSGVDLKSAQTQPNGDLTLQVGIGDFTQEKVISKADLDIYFEKILSGTEKHIDLGSGASLGVA